MKKLILISLVIFFTICSKSWALPTCPGSPKNEESPVIWNDCIGTFIHSDGWSYKGEFKDNQRHGKGTFYFADGDEWEGYFKKGSFNGGKKWTPETKRKYLEEKRKRKLQEKKSAEKRREQQRIEGEREKANDYYTPAEREQMDRLNNVEWTEEQIKIKKIEEAGLLLDQCILDVYEKNIDLDKRNRWEKHDAKFLCLNLLKSSNPIYVNCLISKGSNKDSELIASAVNVCANIANNPSALDKIKYMNKLPNFLRKYIK